MDVARGRASYLCLLMLSGLACAGEDDPAATTAATIEPSTSGASMTGMTSDPTMAPTSNPDPDDGVDDAPADSGTSGPFTDVPVECVDGERDCPCIAGECMRGLMCVMDVCLAPAHCDPDPNEPNDIAAEATMLASIDDDDLNGDVLEGVLADPSDVDWFTYAGTDIVGETVDPSRMLTVEGGTLELCKFLDCLEGTELVECPPGSVPAESAGHPGCCSSTSIAFSAEGFECEAGAFETGAQVYIRLRNADAQCVGYEIAYHY